jgi:hypothetical protein
MPCLGYPPLNAAMGKGICGHAEAETAANYENAGYVIAGRAELHIEGQVVDLEPGDSWLCRQALATATKSWKLSQHWRLPPHPAEVHGRDKSEPTG